MKNYRNFLVVFGAILFFGMSIWNSRLLDKIENLNNVLYNLQNQVSEMQGNNDEIISTIQSELQKKASIMASHQYEVQNYNPEKKVADIHFSIAPKNQTNATKVKIAYQLNVGREESVELGKQNSSLYEGKITVPVTKEIQYRVLIENNGVTEVEEMESIYDLKGRYTLDLQVEPQGGSYSLANNQLTFSEEIGLHSGVREEENQLAEAHVEIVRNNEIVKIVKFKAGTKNGYDQYATLKNINVKALPKDRIEIVVKAKDSNEFSYTYKTEKLLIKEKNEFDMEDNVDELNQLIIE